MWLKILFILKRHLVAENAENLTSSWSHWYYLLVCKNWGSTLQKCLRCCPEMKDLNLMIPHCNDFMSSRPQNLHCKSGFPLFYRLPVLFRNSRQRNVTDCDLCLWSAVRDGKRRRLQGLLHAVRRSESVRDVPDWRRRRRRLRVRCVSSLTVAVTLLDLVVTGREEKRERIFRDRLRPCMLAVVCCSVVPSPAFCIKRCLVWFSVTLYPVFWLAAVITDLSW